MKNQKELNGVNVDQLVETINAIKGKPGLAEFKFRATNEWINGGHSRTKIKSFYGAGQEDNSRKQEFILEGDEPPVLLGKNNAPNAVEAVLHALASCLSVGFVYNAAARGIKVEELEMNVEGNLDLHAFLGLSESKRPGYNNIDLSYKVKADGTEEEIKELCNYVQKTSPVMDIIKNPVPVTVKMEKLETAEV